MPRPRKDSEILSATERLENAFWELLADHEYRKITVTEVVREAHVNRNSFYYHYASLPELADSAIMHAVEHSTVQAPRADLNPDIEWRRQCSLVMNDPVQRQRLDRLALLAGSHSSPELIESLKDFGRLMIINDLQLDADNLDLKTDLMLDFTVGGILAVLRRWPELSKRLSVDDLLNEDVAVLAMGVYLSMSKENMLAYWSRISKATFQEISKPPTKVACRAVAAAGCATRTRPWRRHGSDTAMVRGERRENHLPAGGDRRRAVDHQGTGTSDAQRCWIGRHAERVEYSSTS